MVRHGPVALLVLVTLFAGVVAAAEVMPPAGTSIKFDTGSPTAGKMHIAGSGEYTVPAGWSSSEVKLRIYTVVNGKKGNFVKEAACKAETGTWSGHVGGLNPNTEYWVEAKLKVTKDKQIINPDYAYVTAETTKKTTN